MEKGIDHTFPTLYKKNSKGKIQFWNISVVQNSDHSSAYDIYVNHGYEGGKTQTSIDTIFEGKNIGKANETSVFQQAYAEAKAKWTKQQERKGYKQDKSKLDLDERPGAEAMLAHRYDKYPDKIEFPCFIQPKLDGHRCLAVVKDGKCKLFSRQRKEITGLPHIVAAVEDLGLENMVLDGELYHHDYRENFEDLTGFIRSQEPKEGHEVVQYHLYDLVSNVDYENRFKLLIHIVEKNQDNPTIQFVPTVEVTQDRVMGFFKALISDGYEGAILRNKKGGYEGKRSYNLQKVKVFDDTEFVIQGVTEGRGSMKGHAIFECHVIGDNSKVFKAKMKGNMDHLVEIFNNKEAYIGKFLTVQYQGLTKEGIPRFPVGLRVRESL